MWAHGDYCKINPKTGGIVMLGRRSAIKTSFLWGNWLKFEVKNILLPSFFKNQFINEDYTCAGLDIVILQIVCIKSGQRLTFLCKSFPDK